MIRHRNIFWINPTELDIAARPFSAEEPCLHHIHRFFLNSASKDYIQIPGKQSSNGATNDKTSHIKKQGVNKALILIPFTVL